eukprot:CAMPEP_0117051918 /NCGR_PEP_ID=MMETSP0472-20121206/35883_1 /TAXON_ID=693140 ORGANISM="Tiarina fusus, Strain LIS" /NCGR_SAMPLE_ID=MMETSP0472 /ASSEMBLY_ACC=CAM_ASM_000603 /LENGTH=81 /DNA_ID=CAMNT_0004766337 /DNA_START=146 /DNA_END=388 /DNA_ORIENTATION=+
MAQAAQMYPGVPQVPPQAAPQPPQPRAAVPLPAAGTKLAEPSRKAALQQQLSVFATIPAWVFVLSFIGSVACIIGCFILAE